MNFWKRKFFSSMDEIVFEKKNKKYGAYFIRKSYQGTLIKSGLFAILFLALLFFAPAVGTLLNPSDYIMEDIPEVEVTQLMEPPVFELPPPSGPPSPPEKEVLPEVVKEVKKPKEQVKNPVEETEKLKKPLSLKDSVASVPDSSMNLTEDSSNKNKNENEAHVKTLKMWVDQLPAFPGGENAFKEFLKNTILYPANAKKSGVGGIVFVTFMINPSGQVKDVKILAGINPECDQVVVKALERMPNWIPGKKDGKNISFLYNFPIQFALK